jgi:hypothetical protein
MLLFQALGLGQQFFDLAGHILFASGYQISL